jgi:hypothetical protein
VRSLKQWDRTNETGPSAIYRHGENSTYKKVMSRSALVLVTSARRKTVEKSKGQVGQKSITA